MSPEVRLARILSIDGMPLTRSAKIDHKALGARYAREAGRARPPGGTPGAGGEPVA